VNANRLLLSLLVLLFWKALLGCPSESDTPALSRVAAVPAAKPEPVPREWCDFYRLESEAPGFELPPWLPAGPAASVQIPYKNRWTWINLWATWCKPCLREIPLLFRWKEVLSREGQPVQLWFVSIDQDQEELANHLKKHPELASGASSKLSSPDDLGAWLAKYRLDSSATVPIQVLISPGGKIRCIRTGSIGDSDYPVVRNLLGR
jgi:thiol-disulfide isomerase/thioredoxin